MGDQQLTDGASSHPATESGDKAWLARVRKRASSPLNTGDYKPDERAPRDYRDSIENSAREQQIRHRDTLLRIVSRLALGSFLLLVVIVVFQMLVRLYRPDYTGVSDTVIQIIAVSVFGQVLTVMGGLSYHLWKKSG